MSDLAGLIERLEKATGSDRELDKDLSRYDPSAWRAMTDAEWSSHRKLLDRLSSEPCECCFHIQEPRWQQYTSSIDAALTLVPEGWVLQLDEWDDDLLRARGPWQAILIRKGLRGTMKGTFDARCDNAPTPAIALVIAALKARATERKDKP